MERLRALVARNEDWLIDRVVDYAKAQGYMAYTSTLRGAWRASICGLSEPLMAAIELFPEPPEIFAEENLARNPIAAFGVEEAQKHRARGITLDLFLGLTKFYRRAYVDLVMEQRFPAEQQERYRQYIERFFDLVELGICTDWSSATEGEKLAEVQERNRLITNEKNKYLTIFESLEDPVVLLDDTGAVQNMNHAAQAVFGHPADPGKVYYGAPADSAVQDKVDALMKQAQAADQFETTVETEYGQRHFDVRVQQMLDISAKFVGTVLTLNDVTEHMRATKMAEAANRAKSTFLATMSHEIRTPISGVLGMASLLTDTRLSAEQRRYLEGIVSSGEVLMSVLNDILDYSKIEAGVLELESIEFDLRRLLDQAVDLMAPSARRKGLRLAVSLADELPSVIRGDPGRIRQVLLNLVNNAIKFTPSGSVSVRVDRSGERNAGAEQVRFEVVDTGIGISGDQIDRLFQPFTQQDSSIARRFGGSGLGLAVCQELVTAMGGRIDGAANEDGGSTFGFEIPLQAGLQSALQADRATVAPDAEPRSVLLVEDNAINSLVAEGFLKREGHLVTVADNAEEALSMLQERSFDLLLMDIRLPGLSGLDAVRRIRADIDPERARVPIIIVSANVVRSEVEGSFAAGADAFLGKPFSAESLRDAITQSLSEPGPQRSLHPEPDRIPDGGVIDTVVMRQHMEQLGSERAGLIVGAFLDTSPDTLAKLKQAFDEGAFDRIADHAHSLKGAAGHVGLLRLSALAGDMEAAAEAADEFNARAAFEALSSSYDRSVALLQQTWRGLMEDEGLRIEG